MEQPAAVPSILAYTQPVAPRMPTAYYPGPAPVMPMWACDLDSDSDDGDAGPRRLLAAVVLAVIVVLVLVLLYYMFQGGAQSGFAPFRSGGALASGLAKNGWTVYLMEGCGACKKQMGMPALKKFGRHVLCSKGAITGGYTKKPPLACSSVRGFPSWYNTRTKETRVGVQDLAALERMARAQ